MMRLEDVCVNELRRRLAQVLLNDCRHAEAMVVLGDFNKAGAFGGVVNMSKAIEWYTKAAQLGDDDAMYNLGEIYEKGNGVSRNIGKAKEWYKKAAALENVLAEERLSFMK